MICSWHICHVDMCRFTKPPKSKFVAIVCANPKLYGFLINSTVCQFVQDRPELKECQVIITESQYRFLTHTSFVDCSKHFEFEDWELTPKHKILENTKNEIIKVVSESRLFTPSFKELII